MDINERRKKVKQFDLVQLAIELGYTPIAIGRNYFTLKEHDSVRIKINTNTFTRYSNGAFGDPVSFLMEFATYRSNKFKSLSYCVMWLENKLNIDNKVDISKHKAKTQKVLILPEKDINYRRIYAYLIKTRMIDREIIDSFVKRKMLYQEKEHKNAVFIGYDTVGKPVYAMQRSTLPNFRFINELEGCNYDYGISYSNDNADTLIITEAVIDMMSIMTIYKEKNFHKKHSFLALGGTDKDNCIYKYLDEHLNICEVLLGLDNDEAGIKATKRIQEKLQSNYKNIKRMVIRPTAKDWNEELINKSTVKENQMEL